MMGVSRTVAGDKTVEFEYLRIEQREDGIYYVAHPKARCPGTDFKLTRASASEAVFENPQHDFPKRIIYRKTDDGLTASIDAGEGSKGSACHRRPFIAKNGLFVKSFGGQVPVGQPKVRDAMVGQVEIRLARLGSGFGGSVSGNKLNRRLLSSGVASPRRLPISAPVTTAVTIATGGGL
jgi:hypothetical protein